MTIILTGNDVSTTAAAATGELSPGFFVSQAEERALRLIGGWMDESSRRAMAGEQVTEESTAHFYSWLDDPRDRRAKERALDIIMEGCSDDRYSCEGLTGGCSSVRTFDGNTLNDNTFNDNTHTTINILFN